MPAQQASNTMPDVTNGRGYLPWTDRHLVISSAEGSTSRLLPQSVVGASTLTPISSTSASDKNSGGVRRLIRGASSLEDAFSSGEKQALSRACDDLHQRLDLENPYEGCSIVSTSEEDLDAQKQCASPVGVSYQIVQLGKLDTVDETMSVGLELTMLFRVSDEEELGMYREKCGEELGGNGGFVGVSKNLPRFTLLSAVEEPEVISETIVAVKHCVDRPELQQRDRLDSAAVDDGEDGNSYSTGWYVQTYGKYRMSTQQMMDLQSFPFSRLFMRLVFVNTENIKKYLAVPWNYMLPLYEINEKTGALMDMKFRPSVFKARSRVTGSWMLRNHFAAFYPVSRLAAMPSGAKYSRFHIVFQLECLPEFYLSNVHAILFLLVCLSFATFLLPPTEVGDRMQIILTLVLTLAAYKMSLAAWLPVKPYLTEMDKYVMGSFIVTSLQGAGVMLAGLVLNYAGDTFSLEAVTQAEALLWATVFLLWIGVHLKAGWTYWFQPSKLFPGWVETLAKDDLSYLQEKEFVQSSNQRVFSTQRADVPAKELVLAKIQRDSFSLVSVDNGSVEKSPSNEAVAQSEAGVERGDVATTGAQVKLRPQRRVSKECNFS